MGTETCEGKEEKKAMMIMASADTNARYIEDILIGRPDQIDFVRQNINWYACVNLPTTSFSKAEIIYLRHDADSSTR